MKKGKYLDIKFGVSAATISKEVSEAIEKGTINLESEENLDEFIKGLQGIQEELGRGVNLNLLNINNGKNTIEFRIANGTFNPDVWIDNIRLFGRIVQTSEKLAQIEKKSEDELTEEDKESMRLMEDLKREKTENEKMEILLQLLFEEEERYVYRERYEENSKKLEKKIDNPLEGFRFAKVDFAKNRHNVDEYLDMANKNRYENYEVVTTETKSGIAEENVKGENTEEREEL